MGRISFGLAAAVLSTASESIARAQTYTVESITPMSLGTVAAANSGTTVFLNSAENYVGVISGSGQVVKGPASFAVISIRCVDEGANRCDDINNKARIAIGRTGVNAGRGMTITTLGVYSGTGTIGSGSNETNANIDVPLSGWTASNQLQTFRLSLYWPIAGDDGAGATGSASSQFYVYAAKSPAMPNSGLLGAVTATVRRSLRIAKVSDLAFGTFIRPTSGTNYIAVDATGARGQADGGGNVGAGTVVLVPSSYGAARFNVTGEPGMTFSLQIPTSFSMTGPGPPLAVTLTPSVASGTQTLSGAGTMAVASGGYFGVSASQPSGSYTGSFTVTIAYN